MKIAIIDIIGLPYDGTTVFTQGLGGSESAVTFMAKELAQLNFSVTVFNNCDIDDAKAGIYDGVNYRPLTDLNHDHEFDVVVSSRTVIPFVDPADYAHLHDNRAYSFQGYNLYHRIVSKAAIRVLWMHDTFCLGDNLIEELAVSNRITDIFTLSDFHLTYVANCHHGRRRNFEVLKSRLFITRNGANCYVPEVDISSKDRNLFVYNASVTKGMVPLVNDIWPRVKQQIPTARLKVIGGYYRFSSSSEPDQQEQDWRRMVADSRYTNMGIEFTGVIPQKEIGQILASANFMIYPCAFPETFGISTLESLLYNTPVITCRFGALEEIALDRSCYLIDYAVEPNGLFPDINKDNQVNKFVATVVQAYNNTYLHQQKQYYCNAVKPIAGWDSVALQWKQHFYYKSKQYLSRAEYRQVTKINHAVHKVWQRRYYNPVEMETHRCGPEQKIVVISTFYNCQQYISKCIKSVAAQDYDNYEHILINDCSTDETANVVLDTLQNLPADLKNKFTFINNSTRQGAVYNQVDAIREITEPNTIVMVLDGDDSLVNDNSIFAYYNAVYDGTTEFTYGSCWSMVDNIPLISQPYPEHIKQTKAYRQHKFNWNMPYTHLRTFKQYLIKDIPDSNFQDESGKWYGAGGDGSTFYSLIEAADPNKVKCLQEIVYNYNDINPLNDYKVNSQEQNTNAAKILKEKKTTPMNNKKILIAIPTARNIESETFKSIYDLHIPAGYEADFQYFYGYNIDQVRNLIASWVVNGYDYLFSVDSDIAFPPNTLAKLLAHDVDMVSGLYIQRKPGQHILEVYEHNVQGGVSNIPYGKIAGRGLVQIASCGFGCVLVKAKVMRAIPYPHFKYHSAIDHAHTISEDIDFCKKALSAGFKIWADTNIHCKHIGSTEFLVTSYTPPKPVNIDPVRTELQRIHDIRMLPQAHVDYLEIMKNAGIAPKVIYDIGANVLHWTGEAKQIWPNAKYVAFDAMPAAKFLYEQDKVDHAIELLSDTDGKSLNFYLNEMAPAGNSYYKENSIVNPSADHFFNESHRVTMTAKTLDTVVKEKGFPAPDLIKIDVQGAEIDVLKGAVETLKSVTDIILEGQVVEYNKGAPLKDQVISYVESIGFELVAFFCDNGPDGDYHFKRKEL